MGVGRGLSASFASAAAAGQRLDPLYLFTRLLIKGGVPEVDVPIQARVGVVLVVILSGWMRWMRGRLSRVHWGPFPLAWRSRFALVGAGASSLSVPPILPLNYRLSMVYGCCMVKYLQANEREDG
jgi:hypothetical protein